MSADIIIEDVIRRLERQFGRARRSSKARIVTFGSAFSCSINYSKLLRGSKYFFGLPGALLDPVQSFGESRFGDFVLLICASEDRILVIPRSFIIEMMQGVISRRLDVFLDGESYILQTTRHPKRDITEYLNAFPTGKVDQHAGSDHGASKGADRIHVKMQYSLIALGKGEGCSVWVPINDRNLAYRQQAFSVRTISRLPNFGFDENTRRIVQNIDVLWLRRNVIQKAFEIEATTSVYSGLLRLNDLVLAQPNVQIDLYVAAAKVRREKVYSQLIRPSFLPLLPKCEFISFEAIEEQMKRLETFPTESGARVSGLVRGEKFPVPEPHQYAEDI